MYVVFPQIEMMKIGKRSNKHSKIMGYKNPFICIFKYFLAGKKGATFVKKT